MLKGHTKIELFDAKTGKLLECQEKHNYVTATLQHLLNGVGNYINFPQVVHTSTSNLYEVIAENLPLREKNINGILLYDDSITEAANNYIIPSGVGVTGLASTAYSGTHTWRGSKNDNESGPVYNGSTPIGYRFVWDFGTDKCNGTIGGVSLTEEMSHCPGIAGLVLGDVSGENKTYGREHILLTSVFSTTSNSNQTILKMTGTDIYYVDQTGTTLYKKSVMPLSNIKLLTPYSYFTTPTVVKSLNYSYHFAYANNNDDVCAIECQSNAFVIHVLNTSTWAETTINVPFNNASAYSSYHSYYDGTKLYFVDFNPTYYTETTGTLVIVQASNSDVLVNTTFSMGGGSDSYQTRENIHLISSFTQEGKYVFYNHIYKDRDSIGLCIDTDDNSHMLYHPGLTYSNYVSGGYGEYYYYSHRKIVSTIQKPYTLYQRYASGRYGSSSSMTYRDTDVTCMAYMPMTHTIQNLTEPVTKTAEKTMKITYSITETQ